MEPLTQEPGCLSRRRLLLSGGAVVGLGWLTPLSGLLARQAEAAPRGKPARSLIVLWMGGGPSQLETFDPHPESKIAAGGKAIGTALKGVRFGEELVRLAEVAGELTLVRSLVSREADHERAVYNMKTGYRPAPTVVHPSIGAILCHQMEDAGVDIPRHISILPDQWPARGGYLGAQYDAFQVQDPQGPVQDVANGVEPARREARLRDLDVVERGFARGRPPGLDTNTTLHRLTMERASRLMGSEQLSAFDVKEAPASQRAAYGDTPFGRGCLAALRLVEKGVRCVEVTLGGWDTHVNNLELTRDKVRVLDPAFAALIRDLKERGLLESTVVLCCGEFGRTPKLNPLEGRDHWPYGFSAAIAGGGFRRGQVWGATDPAGESREPKDPVGVQDLHATVLHAMGVDPERELRTPVGRPLALSEGKVVGGILRS